MPRSLVAVGTVSLLLTGLAWPKEPGDAAPDFTRTDFGGASIHLAEYRGKVVLLNFWASWCGPCLEEMPRFSAWQRAYAAAGLKIIGVSMDDAAEPAVRLLARHPVDYPVVLGDATLGETYGGVLGLPLTFLIDRDGHIVARYRGEADLAKMENRIKSLLMNAHEASGGSK
jgi:cytochrome c biogenesis protein CcmG, thiol:disulfide interchange protein DsbE